MANDGFNGSTISFAGSGQTPLRDINYDASVAEVDVSGAGDTETTYVAGQLNRTFTCQIVGGTTIAPGDKGTVAIVWYDGTSVSITNCCCFSVVTSGSKDSEMLTDLRFRPSIA